MKDFKTAILPAERTTVAPDGSDVRVLLTLNRGGLAHFELPPGQTSIAVAHHTVEEIWFFLTGRGQMWRKQDGYDEVADLYAGVCVTIPSGTQFQFRSFGDVPLSAVAVTMGPWPGEFEAYEVEGKWNPSVEPGHGLESAAGHRHHAC